MTDRAEALARLRRADFPRTAAYDPEWVVANQMGPHPLWLLEGLMDVMPIATGARVLDVGCGTALTSIFLARELGARVWAADLWIDPTANWARIRDAGVGDLVTPLRVEAHDLPFADGFFDAVVSIDAYQYFGTDDLYLAWHLGRVVAPGGRIGVVVPGLPHELDAVPASLEPFWQPDFWSFHSPGWWRRQWERSGVVDVERAELVPDGAALWRTWAEALEVLGAGVAADAPEPPPDGDTLALLDADRERVLGFTRIVGRKR